MANVNIGPIAEVENGWSQIETEWNIGVGDTIVTSIGYI